jgi:hypothetical protein
VISDAAGRFEIFLEQSRRHGERFARVVEAGGVGGVDGELSGGSNVDAGEVSNRVVVFGVAEPAREHRAGVASVLAGEMRTEGANPVDHRRSLGGRRVARRFLGRHLFGGKPLQDHFPAGEAAGDIAQSGEGGEVEVALGADVGVALGAVGRDEGPHDVGERLVQSGIGAVGRVRSAGRRAGEQRPCGGPQASASRGIEIGGHTRALRLKIAGRDSSP